MPIASIAKIDWLYVLRTYGAVVTGTITVTLFVATTVINRLTGKSEKRPDLQLARIDQTALARKAVFKNNGDGPARDLLFKDSLGNQIKVLSSALAKGAEIDVPIEGGEGIIDVSFTSIKKEKGRSVFGYSARGVVVGGEPTYGRGIVQQEKTMEKHKSLLGQVRHADARALLEETRVKIDSMKSGD